MTFGPSLCVETVKLTNSTWADSASGASGRSTRGLFSSWNIAPTGWASGAGNSGKGSDVVTDFGASVVGAVDSILATISFSVVKSSAKAVGATFSEMVGTVVDAWVVVASGATEDCAPVTTTTCGTDSGDSKLLGSGVFTIETCGNKS